MIVARFVCGYGLQAVGFFVCQALCAGRVKRDAKALAGQSNGRVEVRVSLEIKRNRIIFDF